MAPTDRCAGQTSDGGSEEDGAPTSVLPLAGFFAGGEIGPVSVCPLSHARENVGELGPMHD